MTITIEKIETAWAEDSKIDKTDLNASSTKQLELHSKYFKILNYIKKHLRFLQVEKVRLQHLKVDYYSNQLPPQQLKEMGWEPNKRVILKGDLDRWVEADEEVINLNLKIGEFNDMKDFVESIIKTIQQKPFIIKNIIENNKFLNGGY